MGGRRATPKDRAAGALLNYRTGDKMHPDASQARSGGREKYETGMKSAIVAHRGGRQVKDEQTPQIWLERYREMCDGDVNVLVIDLAGFSYLFDYCSEIGAQREDRLVAAYGHSRAPARKRDASRMRGFPASDERGDRGHFIAHQSGGALDINLFHQDAPLNRGRSAQGRRYRAMERHCARHPGTFFFVRPIYADGTARPSQIEFGIQRADGSFWIELFDNSPKPAAR